MSSAANDIQLRELRDTISQLNTTLKTQSEVMQKQLADLTALVEEKEKTIANLNAQISYLTNKLYGSTSEKIKQVPGQYSIFDNEEEEEKPAVEIEPEYVEVAAHKRERKPKATYDEIFENIKTTTVPVEPLPEEERICTECGSLMIPIGTEVVRTEVVYHEAYLERIEYLATTYCCPNADKEAHTIVVKDKYKPALISGSYVSSGLAAHVMFAKYALALPLYRQEQDFLRIGAKISRGTMADETPLQVLKEPDRRPQSKSYLWVYRTGEDGYKGYNKVPDAKRCACWAHIRRYWLRAIPKGHEHDLNNPAVQGFMYCDKLFAYERRYKEKGFTIKKIKERRLKDEEPVIDAFLSCLDNLHPKTGDTIIKACIILIKVDIFIK